MAVHNIESFVNPDGTPGHSLNIVKGCNGPAGDGVHCSYCYACRMVKMFRFAEKVATGEMKYIPNHTYMTSEELFKNYKNLVNKIKSFKPHFFEYVYAQKLRKKPTMYFPSISDPADWEQAWYERIVKKINQYPQHTFVVLTKRPRIYERYIFPENVWCGVTITSNKDWRKIIHITEINISNITFCSIEPIQEEIEESNIEILLTGNWCHDPIDTESDGDICYHYGKPIDWLIVGPETGTQKKTPVEWLNPFFSLDIPVFMKDSWKKFTDKKLRQEWPIGYRNEK